MKTTEQCIHQSGICMNNLEKVLDSHIYKECSDFILRVKEFTHRKTMERQTIKFERLFHTQRDGCSNHTGGCQKYNANTAYSDISPMHTNLTTTITPTTDRWVKYLSGASLTKAQASLLAQGLNFP